MDINNLPQIIQLGTGSLGSTLQSGSRAHKRYTTQWGFWNGLALGASVMVSTCRDNQHFTFKSHLWSQAPSHYHLNWYKLLWEELPAHCVAGEGFLCTPPYTYFYRHLEGLTVCRLTYRSKKWGSLYSNELLYM